MKSIYYLLFFIFFFISLIFFNCNKDIPTSLSEKETKSLKKSDTLNNQSNNKKNNPDALWIAPGSHHRDETWRFDHYEPKSGKYIGIWPRGTRWNQLQRIQVLKNRWGFSKIYINEANQNWYNTAINANFTLSNIMIGLTTIPVEQRASKILQFGNV